MDTNIQEEQAASISRVEECREMLVPCTMVHGFISEKTTTLILLRASHLIMWQYIT